MRCVMSIIFYAKSSPVQTIEEHTQCALAKLKQLKEYNKDILTPIEWELLETAVIYHDLGKMDIKFQNKIRKCLNENLLSDTYKDVNEIPHNYLSPVFFDKKLWKQKFGRDMYEILIKAVYYHHNREWLSKGDWEAVEHYVKNSLMQQMAQFSWEKINLPLKLNCDYFSCIGFDSEQEDYDRKLLKYEKIKGLLNRIDYCASSGMENIEEPAKDKEGKGLVDYIQADMSKKEFDLRPVQQYMKENCNKNLVVVASTGVGKTEASLLWLNNQKGFYTLPLKVSINAIYDRVKRKIGYEKVRLLHSDAFSVYLNEAGEEEPHIQYSNSKLLAAPLTLCTIDQLFKFVFRYNGGEMPLATLSYSKLIIDEIQMYSPDLVAIILVGLKTITDMGGKFAIVTATFPKILYSFMEQLGIDVIEPTQNFYNPITKRHRMVLLQDNEFDFEKIKELSKTKKVLVICNTVKRAQSVTEELQKSNTSVRLLHSAYLKKHRKKLEQEIMEFAPGGGIKNTQTGLWVSTQIVEASLDIDFDVLFTEMCSVDSLQQRMGRVYRGRWYDLGDMPNIYVLNNYSGYGNVVDKEIYDYSLNAVEHFNGELLEESAIEDIKQKMIDKVFDPKENPKILKSNYQKTIQNNIAILTRLPMYELEKQDADSMFRGIDTKTLMPRTVYEQLYREGKIEAWSNKIKNKAIPYTEKQKIKDEISAYTVSLAHYHKLDFDFGHEMIYKGSKIYIYNGEYDFDEITGTGKGIIKKYKESNKKVDNFL